MFVINYENIIIIHIIKHFKHKKSYIILHLAGIYNLFTQTSWNIIDISLFYSSFNSVLTSSEFYTTIIKRKILYDVISGSGNTVKVFLVDVIITFDENAFVKRNR